MYTMVADPDVTVKSFSWVTVSDSTMIFVINFNLAELKT